MHVNIEQKAYSKYTSGYNITLFSEPILLNKS